LHLVGSFYEFYVTMHESVNIKFTNLELSYSIFSPNTQHSVHSAPQYLEIHNIKLQFLCDFLMRFTEL
jgi:hypothetical protein